MNTVHRAWLALAGGCFAACAQPTPAPTPDASVDVTAADVIDVTDITDVAPDVARDVAPDVRAGPPSLLSATMFNAGVFTESVAGWFNIVAAPGERCSQHAEGGCNVIDCLAREGAHPPMHGVNAGDITISTDMGDPLVIGPDLDDVYLQAAAHGVALWSPGSRITFTAVGGPDVPAFAASLMFPDEPTVTAPALPDAGSTVTVRRSEGFTARWTPSSARVSIDVFELTFSDSPTAPYLRMGCVFDGSSGVGVITPAQLAAFSASGTTMRSTLVAISNIAATDLVAGTEPVRVVVANGVGFFARVE